MLESYIQKKVVLHGDRTGWVSLKITSFSKTGWPDYIFLKKQRVLFIEFKRPGQAPTKKQEFIHKVLRSLGFDVFVVSDIDYGKALLDRPTIGKVKDVETTDNKFSNVPRKDR